MTLNLLLNHNNFRQITFKYNDSSHGGIRMWKEQCKSSNWTTASHLFVYRHSLTFTHVTLMFQTILQLLNALCGRAYYGKTSGKVKINGNDALIEENKAVIGFVPQDDIVYPDLTVKENLLYSGRFLLPNGTSEEEISELADVVMASLGLSRIAHSLVGDATRRGISGGEKKR